MNRRTVLEATLLGTAFAAASVESAPVAAAPQTVRSPYVTAKDGTKLGQHKATGHRDVP